MDYWDYKLSSMRQFDYFVVVDDCDYGEQVGSGVWLAMLDFRSVNFVFTGSWVVHF